MEKSSFRRYYVSRDCKTCRVFLLTWPSRFAKKIYSLPQLQKHRQCTRENISCPPALLPLVPAVITRAASSISISGAHLSTFLTHNFSWRSFHARRRPCTTLKETLPRDYLHPSRRQSRFTGVREKYPVPRIPQWAACTARIKRVLTRER